MHTINTHKYQCICVTVSMTHHHNDLFFRKAILFINNSSGVYYFLKAFWHIIVIWQQMLDSPQLCTTDLSQFLFLVLSASWN